MYESEKRKWSRSVVSDPQRPSDVGSYIYYFIIESDSLIEDICENTSNILKSFPNANLVFFFLNFYFYFILLYSTVLVLPYIDMKF